MKIRKSTAALVILSLVFSALAVGVFIGRRSSRSLVYAEEVQPIKAAAPEAETKLVNINTADVKELAAVDGISEALAEKIVESRERWGRFDSLERLLMIDGINERKLGTLREKLTVE